MSKESPKRSQIDVSKPEALLSAFSEDRVRFTIRRMASKRDKDDLITHPLRRLVLTEYGDHLAKLLSAMVPSGNWAPSSAYPILVAKRSGIFRELVFPSLIDSIVGRRIIDELEPRITKDDNNRAFCGRSHASSNREPGDYTDWFQVWQDFTSAIASAARDEGFAFVFETDIAEFFPSVNRERARQVLAQRTGAHPRVLDLLFYCLESWLPRFNYAQGTGLPIEPNDISRLVAHAFIKAIDDEFPDTIHQRYRRYVDDTVVFVDTLEQAEDVRHRHHLALRAHGLAPNASKTEILSIAEYEAGRHRDINLRLDRLAESGDKAELKLIARDWWNRDRKATESWDQVARRLYSLASRIDSDALRVHAISDAIQNSSLASHALRYLSTFLLGNAEVERLKDLLSSRLSSVELQMEVAKTLSDSALAEDVDRDSLVMALVDFICRTDDRHGAGFAKARALLGVSKYSKRSHRERLLNWVSLNRLADEQLRLHFAYVFYPHFELPPNLAAGLRHLRGDDFDLTARLCEDARRGKLIKLKDLLYRCVEQGKGRVLIRSNYLPFIRLVRDQVAQHGDEPQRRVCKQWAQSLIQGKRGKIIDPTIREFIGSLPAAIDA